MAQHLQLPTGPHAALYTAAILILRSDRDLKGAIRTWRTWEGHPHDIQPITVNLCPAISLFPSEGPDSFYGPSGFRGSLVINLGLAIAGTKALDLLNLYHAVRRAFYPSDRTARIAIRRALLAAGALNEDQPQFPQPAMGIQLDDDNAPMLLARGQVLLQPRVLDP